MGQVTEPIACSLPLRQAAAQVSEWADLQSHARAFQPLDNGLVVTYDHEVADAVEDLVAREASCCAWLSLEASHTSDGIEVTLTSENPDAGPVIEALAGKPR